jgi:hypothetical protein
MRQEQINIYKFDELSNEAKEKAVDEHRDFLIGLEWYESIMEDAKAIGFELIGWDSYFNINAEWIDAPKTVAQKILAAHGKECDTYKDAQRYFIHKRNKQEAHNAEFLSNLKYSYKRILQREYEHQTSDERVIESIQINDYEFTEDGKLY